MNLTNCLSQLATNAEAIMALVRHVSEEQARWKPTPGQWSILEVLNHLHDEEREDFRQRLDYLLYKPGEPWPPNDPVGWVTQRGYNQRDFITSLDGFWRERQDSLKWLADLKNPDWSLTYRHPTAGIIWAGDLLGAWVAHDHLHIRQLNELHWHYLSKEVTSAALNYAGEW